MIRSSAIFALLFSFGLSACSPELGDAPFRCNNGEPACPEGYACNTASICVPEGTCPAGVQGCDELLPEKAVCGDGQCHQTLGESCESCVKDCGPCADRCGDGRCSDAAGEDCGSCTEDCGGCAPRCGDADCDDAAGEDCESCSEDCGACTAVCGDGKCEGGVETCSGCVVDCGPCPVCSAGETRCVDSDALEQCSGGQFISTSCETLCKSAGDDYGSCSGGNCECADYAGFGEICNATTRCQADLVCATYDGKTDGFCTSYCTSTGFACEGGGWTEWAECGSKVVSGQQVCLFWCDNEWDCPRDMVCPDYFLGGYCEPRR